MNATFGRFQNIRLKPMFNFNLGRGLRHFIPRPSSFLLHPLSFYFVLPTSKYMRHRHLPQNSFCPIQEQNKYPAHSLSTICN